MQAAEKTTVRLNVDLDREIYKALKHEAVEKELHLSELMRQIIADHFESKQ